MGCWSDADDVKGEIVTLAELLSANGRDRLRLVCVREDWGMNFHALSLEIRTDEGWQTTSRVTQAQFQGDHPNRRWVSDLHSFAPGTGVAIIQVAEGDKPWRESQATLFTYSWRRWDLRSNSEIARLGNCKSPFDALGRFPGA
jgi:hypothetical protein